MCAASAHGHIARESLVRNIERYMKLRLKYTTRTRANGRKLRMQVAGVGKLVVLFRSPTEGDVDPYHKVFF